MKALLTAGCVWLLLILAYGLVIAVRIWPPSDKPVTDPFAVASLPWFVGVNAALAFVAMLGLIPFMLWSIWRSPSGRSGRH